MSHRYSYFSWWWAHSRPKHVEKRNKRTKKNSSPSWLCLQDYTGMHGQQNIKFRQLRFFPCRYHSTNGPASHFCLLLSIPHNISNWQRWYRLQNTSLPLCLFRKKSSSLRLCDYSSIKYTLRLIPTQHTAITSINITYWNLMFFRPCIIV